MFFQLQFASIFGDRRAKLTDWLRVSTHSALSPRPAARNLSYNFGVPATCATFHRELRLLSRSPPPPTGCPLGSNETPAAFVPPPTICLHHRPVTFPDPLVCNSQTKTNPANPEPTNPNPQLNSVAMARWSLPWWFVVGCTRTLSRCNARAYLLVR